MYSHIPTKFASKKHEIFHQIEQKICFKIGVGKSMKIFFIRNVKNNIPWPLKVLPVMPVTIFPRKIMKKTCFLSPVCHCGTLHSKFQPHFRLSSGRFRSQSGRWTLWALTLWKFYSFCSSLSMCLSSTCTNFPAKNSSPTASGEPTARRNSMWKIFTFPNKS